MAVSGTYDYSFVFYNPTVIRNCTALVKRFPAFELESKFTLKIAYIQKCFQKERKEERKKQAAWARSHTPAKKSRREFAQTVHLLCNRSVMQTAPADTHLHGGTAPSANGPSARYECPALQHREIFSLIRKRKQQHTHKKVLVW